MDRGTARRVVAVDDPEAVALAAAALHAGEPIVVPTETVYGLAALPTVAGAVDALFTLKGRAPDVPMAVLVAAPEQAETLAELPPAARRLAARWWPGPLTLVLPRRPGVTLELGGDAATIGIRCPDHAFIRALTTRTGPIAATSANRHGQPTPPTAVAAADALAGTVAVVVDGGRCGGVPSTVVDCTAEPVRVVREGALDARTVLLAAAS